MANPIMMNVLIIFRHKYSLVRHNRFSTLFFSMKIAESGKIVVVSCIIDFKDIQVWLRQFSLNLNAYKVMMVFFKIWPENLKKTIITLKALRFKLNCLNQTCISLKSIMQLTKTIFPDSAIFFEKKRVENRLWRKSEYLWRKKNIWFMMTLPGSESNRHLLSRQVSLLTAAAQAGIHPQAPGKGLISEIRLYVPIRGKPRVPGPSQ